MYLYSITINIDDDVKAIWLQWLKDVFIDELFKTNLFVKKNILEMINEEKSDGTTYSLQLFMNSIEDYNQYEEQFCYNHQVLMHTKFQGKFVEFRTLLKLID